MEISNFSFTFWEGTEPAEPVMNLKLALYSNAWGLEAPTSYTPQVALLLLKYKISYFLLLLPLCAYKDYSLHSFFLAQSTSSCQLTWYAYRYELQPEKDHHSDKKIPHFTILSILGIEICCTTAFNTSAVCAFQVMINFKQTLFVFLFTSLLFVVIPSEWKCNDFFK